MGELFNPQAADAAIAGRLVPDQNTLPSCIKEWSGQRPIRICGGGTTSTCARPDQWSVDLRPGFQTLSLASDRNLLRIGAGLSMGQVLGYLASYQRTIPAGLSGKPGLGYILTGGMGPLSRLHGLAIDQLEQIKGVWGNGTCFELHRPNPQSPTNLIRSWRGLCGAAPFLSVVTEVSINTLPLEPLAVSSLRIAPKQLAEWIQWAERQGPSCSLQWHWGEPDQIQLLVVDKPSNAMASAHVIEGLYQLPALASRPAATETRTHSEVVGLLGPANGQGWLELIPEIQSLINQRPHPGCTLACQQIGEATSRFPKEATSFVHREAIWKPWITASWPADDTSAREHSLDWLRTVWSLLEPICPGVHLAQLHDHLPWHQHELSLAFPEWLPDLRKLKQEVDPDGNLPAL